jgi:outer membrane protein OmpU
MDKIKKLGLTALAGSLVATSVAAGDLGVTGSWSWSWDSSDTDESGNPMSMGDSVTFSGSGETDQGWTATVALELDGNVMDDQSLTLDFGDGGVLQYGGTSKGGRGVGLVADYVPNADTPIYSATAGAGDELGVARGASGTDNISHQITVGDIKIGAEVHKGAGTSTSWGLQYTGIDNLTVGAGTSDISPGAADGGSDSNTVGLKYAIGGITLGYQVTEVDKSSTDEDAVMYGASFAVNDDLTISYGRQTVELQSKADDEINSGFSASYTMGSMSIGAYINKTENVGGASANDDEGKGITVSIAF